MESKLDYEQRESSISDEVQRLIRWSNSCVALRAADLSESTKVGRLNLDLYMALFTAYSVRVLTFFERNQCTNSLERFVGIAQKIGRINSEKAKMLLDRLDKLMNTDDFKRLKLLRNKSIAHWDIIPPPKRTQPIMMNNIITEIVSIFSEAGGGTIDGEYLNEDVENGWEAFRKQKE